MSLLEEKYRLTAKGMESQHGIEGFWCQPRAVFIRSKNKAKAIELYKTKVEQGEIDIYSDLEEIDAYQIKTMQKALEILEEENSLVYLKSQLDLPDSGDEALIQIGDWLKETCLMLGASPITAFQVAGLFLEALKRDRERG